jgi:hypothetical protein
MNYEVETYPCEENGWLSTSIDVLFLLKIMNEKALAVLHQLKFRRNAYKKIKRPYVD